MIPLRALARHATGSRELVAVLSSILIVLALSLAIPINAARSPPGVAGANLAGPRPAAPSSQTPSQFTNTYCNLSRAPGAGKDLGTNSFCFSPSKASWARGDGNFTLKLVSLVLSTVTVPITTTSMKNSSVVELTFSTTDSVGGVSCSPSLVMLFRNTTASGSYNRDIVISGQLGCSPSSSSLQLQLVNSASLPSSACDTSPHTGPGLVGGTAFPPCTSQFFGSMGFSWSDAAGATYDNSTDVLTIPLSSTFSIDPLALDGSGATDSNPTGSTATVSLTTSNNNDIIVLGAGSYFTTGSCTISSVTDNLGTHLTWTKRGSAAPDSQHDTEDWYSSGWTSHGAITLTVTWSATCTSIFMDAFGVSGANVNSPWDSHSGLPAHSSDFAGGTEANVTLSTTNSNDFIFGFAVNNGLGWGSDCSGFSTIVTGPTWSRSIYEIVSSAQTNLVVCVNLSQSQVWMILADAVVITTVTQPITCTTANSAPQATVTLSGASVTPTTLACDGTQHSFTASASSTITLTVPTDGSTTRYRFSGPSTTTTVPTCATSPCTGASVTVYYQYSQSVAYSINSCDSGATCSAPNLTYTQSGSVTQSALTTTASTYWIDYGTTASVPSPYSDSLGNLYYPYFYSWSITAANVVSNPVVYWCGL